MMDIGSQFAINIDKIKFHPKEFYTSLLPLFNETYATADFCFEKGVDPLFGPDVFNYDLKHIKKLDLTKTSLDKLLFENVVLNKIDAVKNLIEAGVNINGLHTNNNITVLSIATENNFTSMVDLIIQGGADVNLKDPLSLSVRLGYFEITRLLLEAGANTEATVQGKTPLYVAAYLGHAKDAEYLLKHNATYQSDERYTPLYIANYFRDKSAQHNALNNLLMNYYWENINKDIFAIQPNDKTFEVVIVRFNEDLDWVYKEFGNNTNVTIYNKGEDDLDYLSPNYKIVKTPNVGWFGGTILLHIANNYNQLTDRTLFIQACPYDAPIFLPLLRYKNNLNSNCNNIIAKCQPTNLIVESEVISTLHEHMNGKYEKFAYLNYTITDFFHKFIDEKFDVDKKFMVNLGTQFAIDLPKIKNHPQEYYAHLLSFFNETYATADFYFERSLDPLFGANLQKPAIITSSSYDIAYIINLDRAKDRWNKVAPQLSRANIKYKRFKAIEGKDLLFKNALTNEIFNGNDLQNRSVSTAPNNVHQVICNPNENNPITFNYSGQLLKKPGEFGLWCSNKMIWLDALKNNYNNIIIFEDDIKIKVNNINEEIDVFITHLPANYDLGYLDFKPRNGTQYSLPGSKYVNGFDENFFSWGTHAIVFSKKAIKKLLSFSSYTGAIDIFYWLYSKSRNLNNINKPLLLETYSSSNLNLIEAETGYSFIDEREINIDFKSQYYDSANEELIKAIVNKELNKIRALLEKGANPNHIAKDGNSMLHLAAILGYDDVVDLLLREAVDLDLKHKKGATALAMAVITGRIKVTKLLLKAGADRDIILDNSSLEQMAIKQNHPEVAEVIREHNAADKSYINSLFMHAALKNNIAMVNRYLEAGAEIDHVFQGNITSLLIAVSKGNLELVENLVERGANVNISSPLFTSARNGHSEITKFLIDNGANIEALSNNNDNPIFAAVHNGHYQDVKYLLDAGSSIQSDRLHTPLFEAAYYSERSPERKAIYNLLINHYWKWLEQELKTMPEIESKESFEAVLVRYKEDLHWAVKEYGLDTNVTIYNKGPNDIDYLPSNYKIVNIPNVGWFGGTILYHIVTNYDQLADITFFGQGLIYDQELYLPAIRYKGYINSTCKNIVAKCENTTLLEQSNKLANYTKEQWTASKYNKFTPLNYTMIDYFNKNICPDFPLDKPFKLDLGAQFSVKSSQIRLNSKEYYASKLQDFNDTYSYADFCLEKAWDVMFDPEYAECYKNHLELSGDMLII
jgi:ankyrin repeat protein/GR25 family glycosyltransferase involved in LPS biosynthesis